MILKIVMELPAKTWYIEDYEYMKISHASDEEGDVTVTDNSRAINRVFTCGIITDLLTKGTNEVYEYVVRRYVDDPESKTHGEIVSEIYAHLGREKRNEYYYMNTLLNKLLVGIHNVNTTTALSKVRVGQSIADIVMINGDGKIYVVEIKSALDNFDRLYNQISNYFTAFSKVSIFSSIHELERVERILSGFGDMGEAVGIYVLSDHDTIFNKARSREPKQYVDCLEYSSIFKLMRKREYESVLRQYYGEIPQTPPAFYFKTCLELFKQIPILTAQGMVFLQLKKRNHIDKSEFEGIQRELKSVVYFSGLSSMVPALEQLLRTNYRRSNNVFPVFER